MSEAPPQLGPPASASSLIGVGIDVTDTRRFDRLVERGDRGTWARWYTEAETRDCLEHHRPGAAAGLRFAVKEATYKAVGAHIARELRWSDIEVLAGVSPWRVRLHAQVAAAATAAGVDALHVTTCQTGDWSMATVIASSTRLPHQY